MNTLQSSALPLDGGGYVVTVVAPSKASFQALLGAINRINPDAFEPVGPMPHGMAAALLRDLPTVRGDDEGEPYIVLGCATGACGVD